MKAEQMLGLLLLILGLQGNVHAQVQTFNDGTAFQLPASYNVAWMQNVNDDFLISQLTLPGTQDTMARYGGPAIDRQAWTLEDQLKAGIRFLDLKAFAFEDTLYLMHGVLYELSTFTEALDTIKKFLSDYPSETVLIRIKPELFDKSKVQELVQTVIANDANVWVQSEMPTVGMVRGKVVFVQRDRFKLGLPLVETGTKAENEVDNIQHKEEEIVQNINRAINQCGGQSVVLTHSSGTGIGTFEGMFLTPKRVAEKIDPWLYKYLQVYLSNVPDVCFGVISMDFPGFDLIQTVIDFNTASYSYKVLT